nr:hypothetical protein [Tanacetum cinerariifolium]
MIVEILKEEANRRYQDSPLMMVVKEIISRLLEEEEKLEWWFKQDIDKEEERFEGDEDGGEVRIMRKMSKTSQKPDNIEHKIGSLQRKPDQQAFFSKNSSNEA